MKQTMNKMMHFKMLKKFKMTGFKPLNFSTAPLIVCIMLT